MTQVATFEKVPFSRFARDVADANVTHAALPESMIREWYDEIELPTRATEGSAGYDIRSPFEYFLKPNATVLIPTGLRVHINPGWFLAIFPRSSLGMKYRAQLDNTVGIIDSDYYHAENFGHIMVKITNNTLEGKYFKITRGDRIVQGIFMPFGVTIDDNVTTTRTGGIGSTGV